MNSTAGSMKIRFFLILILACAAVLYARGSTEAPEAALRTVQASGMVRMVGSAPLTSLVISGDEREWYIEREEQHKLQPFQQQRVTVKAREYYRDLAFANGSPAGRQYYLKDIKVITPKS